MAAPAIVIDRSSNQYPIDTAVPAGFNPQQYIYRRLSFDCEKMRFAYEIIDEPIGSDHPDFGDIEKFAKKILAKGHSPGSDDAEDKPLDVKVSRDSYIIFELRHDWTFSASLPPNGWPAVTLGPSDKSHWYGALRYVTETTVSPVPIPACRLVFFAARGTDTANYEQPINFNIVMPDGTAIVVDPDVRFPGNGDS